MGNAVLPSYLLAVVVVVPLVVLTLLVILIYICCSKHFRLNWFERTLLDSHKQHAEEKEYINTAGIDNSARRKSSTAASYHGSFHHRGSTKYSPLPGEVSLMGSNPSTPASADSSSEGSEQFWVPPTVVQKKRAQSLIPALMHTHGDSDNESSPSRTPGPTSSTSLQEMAFNFPPEKLTESVTMVQVPTQAQRQRRRASMQDALDHTKINTRLYDRMASFRQQSFGSIQEENLGSIHFSLDYNREQALLTVRLIQARDLVPRDFSGTADPYCRICLLPNKKTQLQSKVHKKTLNPEFEEEFIFEVLPTDIGATVLEILLYDYDQFSRDECIGQIHLPLEHVDLSEKVILWKGISLYEKKKREELQDLGDLMFSLGYLSSAERLTVVVLKARNLRPVEESKGAANPFVKVSLIYAGKRLKKKKTSSKRGTVNPVWNEALVFNLGKEFLKNIYLEFMIYNDNLIGNNEILGRVMLGPDTSGEELAHWNDMINSKSAMARWHHLTCASTSAS